MLWPKGLKGWILSLGERLDFVVVIGLILAYGLWWFASVGLGYSSSGCDVGLGLANGFPIDKLHDE